MYLIDDVFTTGNRALLALLCFVFLVFILLENTIGLFRDFILVVIRQRVLFTLRLSLFRHIEKLPLPFFYNKGSGYLASRLGSDTAAVNGVMGDTIIHLMESLIRIIIALSMVFILNWKIAFLSLIFIFGMVGCMAVFNPQLQKMGKVLQEKNAIFGREIQESFASILIIKSFLREVYQAQKVLRAMKEMIQVNINSSVLGSFSSLLIGTITALSGLAVMWFGGNEIINGRMTIGQFVAFNSFLGFLFVPIFALTNINIGIQSSLASMERIFEILDTAPEENISQLGKQLKHCKGMIVFQHIYFGYNELKTILRDISFDVPPSSMVAFVGQSGVGKSTMINLLLRYYEPQNGNITIDGNDIKEINLKSLRSHIGIVPQEAILFSTTIYDNIRFGKIDATKEEIIAAAKTANAHDFVMRLSGGYSTQVGERGAKLSGGERQRIAIARAVLKNPTILILDEATSQIDTESEQLIQESLNGLMKNRTTLVIAHRLSTIVKADKIIVLENGQIAEEGGHFELFRNNGRYRKLYDEQFRKEIKEGRELHPDNMLLDQIVLSSTQ
jgi:ABC-type multidrug transport system fused ATPase/permease subunit